MAADSAPANPCTLTCQRPPHGTAALQRRTCRSKSALGSNLSLLLIPSGQATIDPYSNSLYAYGCFALFDFGRKIQDFCGGQSFQEGQALRPLSMPRHSGQISTTPKIGRMIDSNYAQIKGSKVNVTMPPRRVPPLTLPF
jgi:hypothetical protein